VADLDRAYAYRFARWCGGTWLSVIDKLDYIQGMGIDAVWISPISSEST
jgi:glycosidase